MLPIKLLPSLQPSAIVANALTFAPVMALAYLQTEIKPPASISGQVWLVSVVVAAMGLTRIIMWVRGGKDEKKDKDIDKKELYKILEAHSTTLEKIVEIQTRVADSQKQLADNQTRALDLYSRVSENMAIFKVQLENHNDLSRDAIDDIKNLIRDRNETS